jgi:hypothetical protein
MPSALASAVVNTEQMGGQPLALGAGLAAAAVLSLALTVLSLVRRRRHELALLKTLGRADTARGRAKNRIRPGRTSGC